MINFLKRISNNLRSLFKGEVVESKPDYRLFSGLRYQALLNGQKISAKMPSPDNGLIKMNVDTTQEYQHGFRFLLRGEAASSCDHFHLLNVELQIRVHLPTDGSFFANGYQSRSRSEEYSEHDRISPQRPLVPSWSYTYFRNPDGQIILIGSLSESGGFTKFSYDFSTDILTISKESNSVLTAADGKIIDLYIGYGDQDQLFDQYFLLQQSKALLKNRQSGWGINPPIGLLNKEVMRSVLETLAAQKLPLDLLIIGEGWESAGMKILSAEIQAGGFQAGLWLAPILCDPQSTLVKNNPQWLLKNDRGRPVKVDYCAKKRRFYYCLDFYAPGVQPYLAALLDQVLGQWNFDFVQLDHLYAAAAHLGENARSSEVISDLIVFFADHCGDKMIIAAGTPLAPAFGRVDFCQIAASGGLENALTTLYARHQLDGRAFRSFSEVVLSDQAHSLEETFSVDHELQFKSALVFSYLFSGLMIFRGYPPAVSEAQFTAIRNTFPLREVKVISSDCYDRLYQIEVLIKERPYLIYANLSPRERRVKVPGAAFSSAERQISEKGTNLTLKPFQTICLLEIEPIDGQPYLIGATGHLFPAAQIEKLFIDKQRIEVLFHEEAGKNTVLWIGLPAEQKNITINNEIVEAQLSGERNIVRWSANFSSENYDNPGRRKSDE